MSDVELEYAGFWKRFCSFFLDALCFIPFLIVIIPLNANYRLGQLYTMIPNLFFLFFFHVYLVQKYGGTPGKLIMKIRIRKLDGSAVTYKEAFLRWSVDFFSFIFSSIGIIGVMLQLTDAEFSALPRADFFNIVKPSGYEHLTPAWFRILGVLTGVWVWSEFIVLLTNEKRRALHDFIAGTIVVKI
ncbi:MAG: RDD family protein [Oligoflexia bacterium]|nr:RDD family protein [Oligoflexia bacterium]